VGFSTDSVGSGVDVVGEGVGIGDTVCVVSGASFSTHPANSTTAMIAITPITPIMVCFFIFMVCNNLC